MKKLAISSVIVALAMTGFVAVLWILPHRDTCCAHGNSCERDEGADHEQCRMETNSCDGNGHVRKEVRVIVGDGDEGCMNMNDADCPMQEDACMMEQGGHGMNGCCCCCRMMHGAGHSCGGRGDSMRVEIRVDTTIRRTH